jgi:hypothetical protein
VKRSPRPSQLLFFEAPPEVPLHVVQFGSPVLQKKTFRPFVSSHPPRSAMSLTEQRSDLRAQSYTIRHSLPTKRQLFVKPFSQDHADDERESLDQWISGY